MNTKAELKERYLQEVKRQYPRDEKMQNFLIKRAAVVVPLINNDLAIIEKESIRKTFYFGEGMYTPMEDALKCCEIAETDSEYFINKNLESLKRTLELAEDPFKLMITYPMGDGEGIHRGVTFATEWDWKDKGSWWFPKASKLATDQERAAYIAGVKEAIAMRTKRLRAYLKRYGLKHVETGTYWEDR